MYNSGVNSSVDGSPLPLIFMGMPVLHIITYYDFLPVIPLIGKIGSVIDYNIRITALPTDLSIKDIYVLHIAGMFQLSLPCVCK